MGEFSTFLCLRVKCSDPAPGVLVLPLTFPCDPDQVTHSAVPQFPWVENGQADDTFLTEL